MTRIGEGAKFSTTTSGHIHPDTPQVFYGPVPPTEGMQRGDIWIQTDNLRKSKKKKDAE